MFPGWVRQRIRSNVASKDLPSFPQGSRVTYDRTLQVRTCPHEGGGGGLQRIFRQRLRGLVLQTGGCCCRSRSREPGHAPPGRRAVFTESGFSERTFVVGSEADGPVEFASLVLGNDVRIVGVSAEVVVAYSSTVRCAAKEQWALPSGCLGTSSDTCRQIACWRRWLRGRRILSELFATPLLMECRHRQWLGWNRLRRPNLDARFHGNNWQRNLAVASCTAIRRRSHLLVEPGQRSRELVWSRRNGMNLRWPHSWILPKSNVSDLSAASWIARHNTRF